MTTHEFCYFPFPGGRGEAIRMCIHAAGLDCSHADLAFPAYQEKKKETKDNAWLNGLPVMTIDGKTFTQSTAIIRYVGKKAKLYPTDDDVAALAVDEIMDIVQDCLTKCPQDPDVEVKKAKRQEYAAGKMKSLCDLLNQRAEESSGVWMVGNDMTVADLCVYIGLLKMLRSGDFDHVEDTYMDKYPKLVALEKAVPEHPKYKAYMASKA